MLTTMQKYPDSLVVAYTITEGGNWYLANTDHPDAIHCKIGAQLGKLPFMEHFKVGTIAAIKCANGHIYDFVLDCWRHLYAEKVASAKQQTAGQMDVLSTLTDIDATLAERGARYGSFEEHARITQNIKDAMKDSRNWNSLAPNMKECLEMIAHKAGRILNGDPNYHDSWHDIVGYTKLVADELLGDSK